MGLNVCALGCIKIHFSSSSICLGPKSVPVGTGCRGVADGGGIGGVLTPTFLKPGGGRPLHFLRCNHFFFALNCINIKQTIKLLMLMRSVRLKDEVYGTKTSKGAFFLPIW